MTFRVDTPLDPNCSWKEFSYETFEVTNCECSEGYPRELFIHRPCYASPEDMPNQYFGLLANIFKAAIEQIDPNKVEPEETLNQIQQMLIYDIDNDDQLFLQWQLFKKAIELGVRPSEVVEEAKDYLKYIYNENHETFLSIAKQLVPLVPETQTLIDIIETINEQIEAMWHEHDPDTFQTKMGILRESEKEIERIFHNYF